MKPYVQSNYARIEDDNYQTVDPRCVQALVDLFPVYKNQTIADCCSLNGSKIVDRLIELGFGASYGIEDAFSHYESDWCITNPPFTRGLVDKIIRKQIVNLEAGFVSGVAMLLRNNFDFAKSRYDMFTHNYYHGQIHMMFRPWWSEDKKAQPIHNFVWHVWGMGAGKKPVVKYWREE